MGKHSLLSASSSARWLSCTRSARLEEKIPNKSSSYADEGTAAHEVAELVTRYWLNEISVKDYENKLTELAKSEYYNAEMLEHAVAYATFIRNRFYTFRKACPDTLIELEAKDLDYSKWAKDGRGTGDCIIVSEGSIEVIDFKYGKGHRIAARENTQMRLYALGALTRYETLFNIENIRMTIVQPRVSSAYLYADISVADLLEWAETYVKPRAKSAYEGTGEFAPSEETCKFCRAKAVCKARADYFINLFDNTPDPLLLTADEVGEILLKSEGIEKWLKDIKNFVSKTLFAGESVKDWKLVEGRRTRKYADEIKVAEAMIAAGLDEAELYNRELICLTNMEKRFGKAKVNKILAGLIITAGGKPSLAPADDTRPAITPEAVTLAAFDDVDDESGVD